MTIGKDLTPKLQKLVLRVEDDVRTRLDEDAELKARWQSEHADALHAERTSSAWVSWRDDRITQAAVGWVLTTVFLRFCEDNALLSKVWIAGPGARRQEAFDAENAYFRAHPENTWREWILEGVSEGRYHAVDRWTPRDGDFREACIYLLELAGVETDTLGNDFY